MKTWQMLWRLLSVIGEGLTVSLTLVLMLRVDVGITVATTLPLLAVVLVARAAGKRLNGYRERSRAATGQVTGYIGELFGMVQAVKLAGAEERVTDHSAGAWSAAADRGRQGQPL